MSRNQNRLVMLVNAIKSPDSLKHRLTCGSSSLALFLFSFCPFLTFIILTPPLSLFSYAADVSVNRNGKNDGGNRGCDGGGADLWRYSSVSVYAKRLGVHLTLSCSELSRYHPKMFPPCFAYDWRHSFMDTKKQAKASAPAAPRARDGREDEARQMCSRADHWGETQPWIICVRCSLSVD